MMEEVLKDILYTNTMKKRFNELLYMVKTELFKQ